MVPFQFNLQNETMHRKKLGLICLALYAVLCSHSLQAQSANSFSSDRLGMANTPSVVGKHYLQLQFGGSFGSYYRGSGFRSNYSARDWNSNYFLRFGINATTEINVGLELNRQQNRNGDLASPIGLQPRLSNPTRINGIRAGIRHSFFTEDDHDFSLALLVLLSNNQSGFGQLGSYGYWVNLLGAKQISNRIAATGNIGIQHKSSFTGPELNYVVNFSFDMGYNMGLFLEAKNEAVLFEQENIIQWYNSGLFWKLTPNFMLDLHGGYNRTFSGSFSEKYWYGAMGISWKIKAIATKKPATL